LLLHKTIRELYLLKKINSNPFDQIHAFKLHLLFIYLIWAVRTLNWTKLIVKTSLKGFFDDGQKCILLTKVKCL